MEFEDKSNGVKVVKTPIEILAEFIDETKVRFDEIENRFVAITNVQTRLNYLLNAWYIKLDIFSRVVQSFATEKLGLSIEEFKALADRCLEEFNSELEAQRAKDEEAKEITDTPLIVDTSSN